MGDSISLQRLILKAKNGDKDAFGEVYKTLYTPLYRYALSKCREVELAEDICQQSFLRFYEALDSYTPEKPPLAYLFTIAKRLLINHREKHAFTPVDETFFETYNENTLGTLDVLHIEHLAEQINDFLPRLSLDEQEVLRLYFYAELEHKEIASMLDKEESSIRKIKERALKKLRILTQHLHEGHQ